MGNLTDNAMKYIDTEKLKAEIERHIPQEQGFGDGGEEYGYKCALKDIKRFIDSLQQEMWKPSYEQMKALEVAGKTFASFKELNMNTQRAWKIFHEPLESLGNDLAKLMKL